MTHIPKKCEVLVIGGGPAGSMAAALLAQKGIDVVLLEKAKFPRYTVGESLIPHFWKFTDAIGASEAIEEAGFIKKAGGFVHWDGVLRTVSFRNFGFTRPALHVERAEFDQILLDRCKELGTKVIEETTVKGVDNGEDSAIVRYQHTNTKEKGTIEAQYVIDASGRNVVAGKQHDLIDFDENFKFQAYWAYFNQSDYLNSKGEVTAFENRFDDPPMTMISDTGEWGWVWQIVLKDKVSLGALIPRTHLQKFKEGGATLEERFLTYIRQTPLTNKLIEEGELVSKIRTVRDYAYKPQKLAFDRCYLVGDAAAFFDPINSEGITIAMYGATVAAWAVEKSLQKPHRSEFYRDTFCRNLQVRLNLFQLLAFPDEMVPNHLVEQIRESILNQSDDENYLTLAQLMLTSRGKDFPELLASIGLSEKEVCQTMEVPDELLQALV
ncbi:MAG: NAD(P)/FAD-dependent oxidoreductase [Chitinophagales bacterium]